jgi:hypothetical protein
VLAAELGEPVRNIKREIHRLAKAGVLRYTWLCDEDGVPHGSGYLLPFGWAHHQPGRAGDPASPGEAGDG